jgi:isopentenyl-diphosphate Delta-isomerase
MLEDQVILVDVNDNQIGTMEKMEAHRKAKLHRAISLFIFNSKGEWLLQQRALDKYHSKGLWSNTCCSHPFPGELNIDAANRRLTEEMGMKSHLSELFSFTYKEMVENDLTEHEFDHVIYGISDKIPNINTSEVMDWKYMSYYKLYKDIQINPNHYTIWFRKIFERVHQYISKQLNLI